MSRVGGIGTVLRLGLVAVVLTAWAWFWVVDLRGARFASVLLTVPVTLFAGLGIALTLRVVGIRTDAAWGARLGMLAGVGMVWGMLWSRLQTFGGCLEPSDGYMGALLVTWLASVLAPWLVGPPRWSWATVRSWPTRTALP